MLSIICVEFQRVVCHSDPASTLNLEQSHLPQAATRPDRYSTGVSGWEKLLLITSLSHTALFSSLF